MRASILAVGTELTTGQITNRNAAWLSQRLEELGIETVLHETVADDRPMIRAALDRCRSVSELVFVTGGLGPTTDDFTREVIANWLGAPLEFYEPSWKKITDRLTRLGIPVAESNRQQCFFPRGAEVVVNTQGTADAFLAAAPAFGKVVQPASKSGAKSAPDGSPQAWLWALPGPPREVATVWESAIAAQVRARAPDARPLELLTWQCIGKSEAELGEITERALAGSGLKTGYRAHRPYVEVKVWLTEEQKRTQAAAISALDRAIAPWTATKQGEDLAAHLLRAIARGEQIEVADACSGGILAERLGALLREPENRELASSVAMVTEWSAPRNPESWVKATLSEGDADNVTLAIAGFTDAGEWAFGMREGTQVHVEVGQRPYRAVELIDRARRYAVEFALKRWCEWLRSSMQ